MDANEKISQYNHTQYGNDIEIQWLLHVGTYIKKKKKWKEKKRRQTYNTIKHIITYAARTYT